MTDNQYAVFKRPLSKENGELPADPREVDGVDVSDDGSVPLLAVYDSGENKFYSTGDYGRTADVGLGWLLRISTPETGKIVFGDSEEIGHAMSDIKSSLSTLKSEDMQAYIDKMYQAFDEGVASPADILTPEQLNQQFADSDQQSRLMLELIASGQTAPEESGYQAEVSHPDIQSDSLWGWLVPQFPSGSEQSIKPGMTLAAADYDGAYFVYETAQGDQDKMILSGSEDLEILSLAGVDGEEDITEEAGDSTDSDSGVVVWTGSDKSNAPEPIQSPSDHSDHRLVVKGAQNRSSHALSELERTDQDGTVTYSLPSTSLNAGESVEDIVIVPRWTTRRASTR
ncbi:hypothetical protein [Halovenus salina]|uniref:Envelope protein N-terminal domain-containing protein n=1 Tax=Halovenus salina TaxID=1510225 RepID=A0ABD5VXP7_9EURY